MKVKLDRIVSPEDGSLIFTMRVSEPDDLNFTRDIADMVKRLEELRTYMDAMELDEYSREHNINYMILSTLNDLQSRLVMSVVKDFDNEVECMLACKMTKVRHEICNWVMQNQMGQIKPLMDELFHQTRYYFDNDPEKNVPEEEQQREDVNEDEYEDEDTEE